MNNKIPIVSIVTPTYNHEAYIGPCIESVQKQTTPHWEMIIVDDGSTDKTFTVAQKYAVNDSRIKLIHQENVGIFKLSLTYNKALEKARGRYICILEGDDYWEPEKLQMQVDVMENDPSVVMGWSRAASRVGFQQDIYQVHPGSEAKNKKYYFNDPPGTIFNAVFEDFFPPLTYIIRKDVLLDIGGFRQVLPFPAVDLSTVLELSKRGRFHFFDRIMGTWRIFPNQTTKTLNTDILEGSVKIILNHYRSLSDTEKSILNFDEKYIIDNYKRRSIISYSRGGRFKLIRHDYLNARRDYIKSLTLYGFKEPMWKVRSLIGLVFSYLHLDVELLAKWFGKGSFK